MRSEEVFAVELPDAECAKANTVGDLYRLLLEKLALPYLSAKDIESPSGPTPAGYSRARSQLPSIKAWTTQDVWVTLKAIIQDQLQVLENDISEDARWVQDLGCE
jgi:acyl carrier protein